MQTIIFMLEYTRQIVADVGGLDTAESVLKEKKNNSIACRQYFVNIF